MEAEIRSGQLSVGVRLPNERNMGAQYGVASGTACRAVAELRDRGLVVTLPNKGTYVVAPSRLVRALTALTKKRHYRGGFD
ncbi:GntR family transcriptional regulator [Actinacidiphila alni]|uniref:GntR family transcriptional regulator n=1 Tax=Actinacidiphila alni TaxID=380248 RepID=UPI0034562E50